MQARAEARYLRTSAQKARLVVDLIRGQRAGDAINILRTTNKRIAPSVEKVLRSAIANAENRHNDVDVDRLFVTECYVNEGPRMKRVRPAPMGRAYRIQRRMAHIIVQVGDKGEKEMTIDERMMIMNATVRRIVVEVERGEIRRRQAQQVRDERASNQEQRTDKEGKQD